MATYLIKTQTLCLRTTISTWRPNTIDYCLIIRKKCRASSYGGVITHNSAIPFEIPNHYVFRNQNGEKADPIPDGGYWTESMQTIPYTFSLDDSTTLTHIFDKMTELSLERCKLR